MENIAFAVLDRKVIMRVRRRFCETADELLESDLFRDVLAAACGIWPGATLPSLLSWSGKHEQESSLRYPGPEPFLPDQDSPRPRAEHRRGGGFFPRASQEPG